MSSHLTSATISTNPNLPNIATGTNTTPANRSSTKLTATTSAVQQKVFCVDGDSLITPSETQSEIKNIINKALTALYVDVRDSLDMSDELFIGKQAAYSIVYHSATKVFRVYAKDILPNPELLTLASQKPQKDTLAAASLPEKPLLTIAVAEQLKIDTIKSSLESIYFDARADFGNFEGVFLTKQQISGHVAALGCARRAKVNEQAIVYAIKA